MYCGRLSTKISPKRGSEVLKGIFPVILEVGGAGNEKN
jgi:hypothetical protein